MRFSVIFPHLLTNHLTLDTLRLHSAIILLKALLPFSCFIAYLVAYFSADKTSPG